MPRIARRYQIETTYIFHVLNRGILCQPIFHDEEDFSNFLQIIKRYQQKSSFLVYHWCLMSNHYHIVVEISQPILLSKIIGACQQIYASYYHRKYRTAGRLFQNRFKSQAIEKQTYLLACGRYVELNPVRARLAKHPWDWQWSSASFYVNGHNDGITSSDPEWKGNTSSEYKKWLLDEQAQEEQKIFAGSQSIIGPHNFRKQFIIEARHARPRPKGRPKKVK